MACSFFFIHVRILDSIELGNLFQSATFNRLLEAHWLEGTKGYVTYLVRIFNVLYSILYFRYYNYYAGFADRVEIAMLEKERNSRFMSATTNLRNLIMSHNPSPKVIFPLKKNLNVLFMVYIWVKILKYRVDYSADIKTRRARWNIDVMLTS